jgi:hypothetical protein
MDVDRITIIRDDIRALDVDRVIFIMAIAGATQGVPIMLLSKVIHRLSNSQVYRPRRFVLPVLLIDLDDLGRRDTGPISVSLRQFLRVIRLINLAPGFVTGPQVESIWLRSSATSICLCTPK